MKVTPILNIKYKNPMHSIESRNDSIAVLPAKNLGLPNAYSPLLSFKGKPQSVLGWAFDKKISSLDGVACPCCGVKTISRNSADLLVNRANKINTVKEFSMVLKEAEPYLKRPFKLIVKYVSQMAEENPQLPALSACKMLASGASKIMKNRFYYEAKNLDNIIDEENLTGLDKKQLSNTMDYLKSLETVPKWNVLRENLLDSFGKMDTPKKWVYFENLKDKLYEVYSYSWAVRYDVRHDSRLKYHGSLIKKCLSDSVSEITKYSDSLPDEANFNKLLVCHRCNINPNKFSIMRDHPDFEDRAITHIKDLSGQIALNKLEGDNSYIFNVISMMNKISRKEHTFNTHLITGPARAKIFTEIKSEYAFNEYGGVPCATCGTEMLTHDQKIKLYEGIEECENLHQLKHFVEMNKVHITPKGRKIFERFGTILNEHPDITEKTLFKKLRKQSNYDIAVDLVTQQINLKKFAKKHEFNSLDQILLVDYMCRLDNIAARCLAGQEFVYDEYDKVINDTLDKMLNPHKKNLISMLKKNIKTLYIQDILVRPLPIVVEKTGSKAKAMFQNVFKLASFTVDHTNAKSLGGSDDYYNKLGYCKDCNHEKSGRHFISWVSQHPEMNKNLPKQLVKISEIIKENNLKQFRDYPSEAARNAVKLSRGKLKISTEYKTI